MEVKVSLNRKNAFSACTNAARDSATLGGLCGDMAEEKLNLLRFASGRPT